MIYSKIAAVDSEIGALKKQSNNPFYKSKYLELSDMLKAVKPLLHKHGLLLMQPIVNNEVRSEIYDVETGEVVMSSLKLPEITDPQKLIAATTYYRRGTLQCLLALDAEDDDGNTVSNKTPKAKPALSQERFQAGLDKVNAEEITKEQFIELCSKYTLTDTQSKSIMLLKKV
jgi:hypothetical protein